jgi:hypothetical protein
MLMKDTKIRKKEGFEPVPPKRTARFRQLDGPERPIEHQRMQLVEIRQVHIERCRAGI